MLTFDRANELFSYDPCTGILTWKVKKSFRRPAGSVAGNPCKGTVQVMVDYKNHKAHRIIWLLMTGKLPNDEVDHIDGDPLNNRWQNLREATHGQNLRNTKIRTDNVSGAKGVHWITRSKLWRVEVMLHGKVYNCGYFKNFDDAVAAREAKARELHGEFYRAA